MAEQAEHKSRVVNPTGDLFSVFETRVQPPVKRQPIVQEVVVEKPRREKAVKAVPQRKSIRDIAPFIVAYQGTGVLAELLSRELRDERTQEVVSMVKSEVVNMRRRRLTERHEEMLEKLDEVSGKISDGGEVDQCLLEFEKMLEDALEGVLTG